MDEQMNWTEISPLLVRHDERGALEMTNNKARYEFFYWLILPDLSPLDKCGIL